MHKITVSYSEKRPSDEPYSSRSFHVSMEVEVPANLSLPELEEQIHSTCQMAERAVKTELDNQVSTTQVIDTTPAPAPRQLPARTGNGNNGGHSNSRSTNEPASNKQIGFLTDIIKRSGYDMNAILSQQGVSSLYDLSRKQCSRLIDDLQQSGQRAA